MNISASLLRVAATRPSRPAIVFEGTELSYAELAHRAAALAGALRARSVRAGDRVALLLPNVPAFPVAFHGVLRLGAIAVPINPTLTRRELDFALQDAGARALVTSPAVLASLDPLLVARVRVLLVLDEDGLVEPDPGAQGPDPAAAAAPPLAELDPSAPAVIIYSSGTTGQPKGVTLSHGNVVSNVETNARECGFGPEDRAILFMPLFHCYGLNVILNSAFEAGATVVMERRFDPVTTPATIAQQRVSMFFGVPATFIMLLQRPSVAELARLRYCYCAAAPLPVEVEQQWRARVGLLVHQAYGLTEASPCVAYNHVREHRAGTIGAPCAGVELRIVDPETGQDLPPGEVGELWVRGPGVMLGYWGRPEATAQAIVDGWLRTGDLGSRDADGYYRITDRLKDMINVGGMKVYPAELEGLLYEHPDVGEAAVVGVPDEALGERVRAYVSPRRDHNLNADLLHAFLRERLAAYKRPCAICVVDALPKGPTGKILRRALRDQARQELQVDTPSRVWTASALEQWIVIWLEQELSTRDVRFSLKTPFAEIGVDSLLAVHIAEALSALLGRPIPTTITWLYSTPERLAAHLVGAEAEPDDARALPDLSDEQVARQLEAELRALAE